MLDLDQSHTKSLSAMREDRSSLNPPQLEKHISTGAREDETVMTYSGTEDIYRELVEESNESWLLGLVAFAVVEEQRIEWMRHHEKRYGVLPGPDEVRKWYEQQPAGNLLRAKGTAENTLQNYSGEVLASLDAEYRKEVEEGVILSEFKRVNDFWRQFGVNVAGGFVGALLFAVLITLTAFLILNDTSPVEIVKGMTQGMRVPHDGR